MREIGIAMVPDPASFEFEYVDGEGEKIDRPDWLDEAIGKIHESSRPGFTACPRMMPRVINGKRIMLILFDD